MSEPPKLSGQARPPSHDAPASDRLKHEPKPADRMSGLQVVALAGLALAVVCVLGALIVALMANRDLLLSELASQEVVVQEVVATPSPSPSPSLTPSPTATPIPRLPTSTPTQVVPPDIINRDKINQIRDYVVNIRGLKPRQDVPALFLTRVQLRERLKSEYTASRISSALDRNRELYVALDMLDPTADFASIALDSAAQNTAGFYTPSEQKLYLVADSVNMFASEEIVYAHEYVHALQDQHFGLSRFLDQDVSADQAIAARALAEGDATLVMGAYQFSEITASELEYMAYRASFVDREVIDAVSPSLGILTFFPYLQGSYFVYSLWVDSGFGWDRVNAAYTDPPVSSEQVMHPEKYLARDMPQAVTLPDLAPVLDPGWQEVDRNVLGEIGLLAWLSDHLDLNTAAEGAAGWDGDLYTLWSNAAGDHILVVQSVWDAPGEAAQFSESFADYVTRRSLGVPELTLNEPGRRIWEYEGRATLLARANDQVLIILAPDRTTLDRVHSLFPKF
jgi:hypothetical protein